MESFLDNNLEGKTSIQKYLYFMVHPVFNYTDSIIILCEQGKRLRILFAAQKTNKFEQEFNKRNSE